MTTREDDLTGRSRAGEVPGTAVQPHERPDLHLLAPVIAVGATMLIRKALDSGYRRVTGRQAPGPRDTSSSVLRVLAWTAVTAAVAAAVEVAVYRLTEGSRRDEA